MKTITIFFFLSIMSTSFAQLSITVSGGIDTKGLSLYDNTGTESDNAYWKTGSAFGINSEYSLTDKFLITYLIQYTKYKFDYYAANSIRVPEIHFISGDGANSEFWRISAEVKYFPFHQSRVRFFILTGVGLLIENIGTVTTKFGFQGEENSTTNEISSPTKTTLIHSLGIGIRTNVTDKLFFDASFLYYSNYSERFQTFLGLTIGYTII